MTDEIMKDVWAVKDEISQECKYSTEQLADLVKKRQASSTTKIVNYHNRTIGLRLQKVSRFA